MTAHPAVSSQPQHTPKGHAAQIAPPTTVARLPVLDLVRCFCHVWLFVAHFVLLSTYRMDLSSPLYEGLKQWTGDHPALLQGHHGVDILLILSSFLLSRELCMQASQQQQQQQLHVTLSMDKLVRIFISRFLRLYLPYVPIVLVPYVAGSRKCARSILRYLTLSFTFDNKICNLPCGPQLWTVPLEILSSAFVVFVGWRLSSKALVGLLLAVNVFLIHEEVGKYLAVQPPIQQPAFMQFMIDRLEPKCNWESTVAESRINYPLELIPARVGHVLVSLIHEHYMSFVGRISSVLVGLLLSRAFHHRSEQTSARQRPSMLLLLRWLQQTAATVLAAACLAGCVLYPPSNFQGFGIPWLWDAYLATSRTLVACSAGWLIWMLLRTSPKIPDIVSWYATIGYSFYLTNIILILTFFARADAAAVFGETFSPQGIFAVFLRLFSLCTLAAAFFYLAVEKPSRKLRIWLTHFLCCTAMGKPQPSLAKEATTRLEKLD